MLASAATEAQPSASDAEAVAQTVAERLSDDEALRGDLSDAGFGPILNWATELAIAAAGRGAGDDELSQAARALVRAVVKAAETGDAAPVRGALAASLFTPGQTSRANEALDAPRSASASADERAQALVRALADATTGDQT